MGGFQVAAEVAGKEELFAGRVGGEFAVGGEELVDRFPGVGAELGQPFDVDRDDLPLADEVQQVGEATGISRLLHPLEKFGDGDQI